VFEEKLNAVIVNQLEMKADIQQIKEDVTTVKATVDFLVHKVGEHERDIYILKQKLFE
jgi:hypothetical protein